MTTQNVTYNFAGGQIVQMQYVNAVGGSTTSTTPVDVSGATVNITPTSAANNVIVMIGMPAATVANNGMFTQVLRDASVISGTPYGEFLSASATDHADWYGGGYFCFVDSPATTAALTYKLQFYVSSASFAGTITNATIVLMEVKP